MKLIAFCFVMAVTQITSLHAQTITETTNFLLLGEGGGSTGSTEEIEIKNDGEVWHIIKKLEQKTKCSFDIITHWVKIQKDLSKETLDSSDVVDFDNVADYEISPSKTGKYFITMRGGQNLACMYDLKNGGRRDIGCRDNKLLLLHVEPSRWQKAFEHLRRNFCSGRAF